jgi:GntR family transcriptional repressor for pyruvate dehydrogenase complex
VAATDQAIDGIRELIASGEFKPGAKLPRENELALRLGVSRNSLREAVRALELVGVVEARQGDGTYVTSLDPSLLLDVMAYVIDFSHEESMLQLLEVRRLLEPAATALAAARATPEQLEEIGEALERMDRTTELEALLEADSAFHAAIAHASGNPALAALLGNLAGTTFRARIRRGYSDALAVDETRREHHRIYDALRARDPDLARASSAYHVGGVETWLRGVIEQPAQ